ncbi:MAG: transcription elongation factor GreA [Chloroflexota bacterium]
MVEQAQYLTQEGKETLEKRLGYLTKVRRPEIAELLSNALDGGEEITENTQYEEAKNEQAFLESEIARIERILRDAKIIEHPANSDEVVIGSIVDVVEKGVDEQETYRLVGAAEANPREGKISIESPLGKALLGAKVKDRVKVKAPDGTITFIIHEIR